MANLGNFNANDHEPAAAPEILPPGDYTVQIVKSDMKDTKTGGQMLVLEMEVMDGSFARRRVWDRLNLVNSNQTAVDIANRTLSAICHAIGRLSVSDREELHMMPIVAKVVVRPAQGQYGPANEVKGYSSAGGARPAAQRVAAAPQAAKASPPWRKAS